MSLSRVSGALRATRALCRPLHTTRVCGAATNNSDWRAYVKPLTLQPVLPWVPRQVPAHITRPPYAVPGYNEGQNTLNQMVDRGTTILPLLCDCHLNVLLVMYCVVVCDKFRSGGGQIPVTLTLVWLGLK